MRCTSNADCVGIRDASDIAHGVCVKCGGAVTGECAPASYATLCDRGGSGSGGSGGGSGGSGGGAGSGAGQCTTHSDCRIPGSAEGPRVCEGGRCVCDCPLFDNPRVCCGGSLCGGDCVGSPCC